MGDVLKGFTCSLAKNWGIRQQDAQATGSQRRLASSNRGTGYPIRYTYTDGQHEPFP